MHRSMQLRETLRMLLSEINDIQFLFNSNVTMLWCMRSY